MFLNKSVIIIKENMLFFIIKILIIIFIMLHISSSLYYMDLYHKLRDDINEIKKKL